MRTLFTDNPSLQARLIYLLLVAASAISIGALAWQQNNQGRQLSHEVTRINRYLCLRKHELAALIQDGHDFIQAHPNGTSDFPLSVILRSIGASRVSLRTLSDIHCP